MKFKLVYHKIAVVLVNKNWTITIFYNFCDNLFKYHFINNKHLKKKKKLLLLSISIVNSDLNVSFIYIYGKLCFFNLYYNYI